MRDAFFLLLTAGIGLVSLIPTFVLFRYLDAKAEGEGKYFGSTIKYGGSLAGFVVVFGVLFGAFYKLHAERGVTTPISLDGQWTMTMKTSTRRTFSGLVTIRQAEDDPYLDVAGEVDTIDGPPQTFGSVIGVISGRKVYFFYENTRGDRGVVEGRILDDHPTRLILSYHDLVGFDRNGDAAGMMYLDRRQ